MSKNTDKTTPTPKISVVMPVWNGAKYLREAVQSIITQSFEDFEFLILNDGSTDETPRILKHFARRDPRIRVIDLAHEGIVNALNRGVAEARGDWIARMDCDDTAHHQRFTKQMRALKEAPKAVLCHTAIKQIGEPQFRTKLQRFPRSQAMVTVRLCYQCPIVHPTVVFAKAAFLNVGGYHADERHAEDYGLWGRMRSVGKFVGINEPLLQFRVHGGSISKKMADVQAALTKAIAQRHCAEFMGLNQSEAQRAHGAITEAKREKQPSEWLWFVSRCLPKLRWQSAELWAWAASQTVRRLVK
jgi:glycosyltransferase involved in cell wall biosynthesis